MTAVQVNHNQEFSDIVELPGSRIGRLQHLGVHQEAAVAYLNAGDLIDCGGCKKLRFQMFPGQLCRLKEFSAGSQDGCLDFDRDLFANRADVLPGAIGQTGETLHGSGDIVLPRNLTFRGFRASEVLQFLFLR